MQCQLRNVQKSVMLVQSCRGVGIKFSALKGALHVASTAGNKLDKHKKKQPPYKNCDECTTGIAFPTVCIAAIIFTGFRVKSLT